MSIVSRVLSAIGLGRFVKARMDLTRTTPENKRHWADADALSGRAAYPRTERKVARERSRLEAQNNSIYSGMLRTAANHIIGSGPRLQVQTADTLVNERIENAWHKWADSVGLVDKLQVAVESYWRDGEVFGMRALWPSLQPISLDIRLYESDQVAQPYWHVLDPSLEDGKRIDNLGNAIEYWIYDHHPGDLNVGHVNLMDGQWYESDRVFHLFRADRPGQLRGIPRGAPAIDFLAHLRRFDKATLSAAEAAALWGVFIKTTSSQIAPANTPGDFLAVDFERNMMNFLPDGWEPTQLRADHPTTTHDQYFRSGVQYFCRCFNMDLALALGSSALSNFSSAKLDRKNIWEPEVISEQARISRIVLAPIFRWFLEDCVFAPGVLDGAPPISEIDYTFVWPPLPQADEIDVAKAAAERMASGQSSLIDEWARNGQDLEKTARKEASLRGITVKEVIAEFYDRAYGKKDAPNPFGMPQNGSFGGGNQPENAGFSVENDAENATEDSLEGVPADA